MPSLDAVVKTSEIANRCSRIPDFAAENQALVRLAAELARSPEVILETFVQITQELLKAGSAGVSLISDKTGDFYWPAVSGGLASYLGEGTPRNFGPCGIVIDSDRSQLLERPDLYFGYLEAVKPLVQEVLLAPFRIDGRPVGTIWIVAHDPAQHFDAEDLRVLESLAHFASAAFRTIKSVAQLESQKEKLLEAQTRMNATLAASDVGTWVWDVPADLVYPDANLCRLFGFSSDASVGMPISRFLEVMHEDDRKPLQRRIEATLLTDAPYEAEYRVATATGYHWLHARGKVTRDANFQPTVFTGVVIDVTRRREAEEKILQAKDEAEAASLAKDRFLASLSHELRTPLNPILLLASEGASNTQLSPQVRGDFEQIRKNLELETRLIEDLLDLTRATQGKMAMQWGKVSMEEVVKDAVKNLREEITVKKVVVKNALPPFLPSVRGDYLRLQQVVWNLLKNAIKFTPSGGLVSISAKTETKSSRVVLEFSDSGIGMTAEEIHRVFVPFSQGEHASGRYGSRFGGLGLGLSISHRIVEIHDGLLRATSPGVGEGSTFTLDLPVWGGEESGASQIPIISFNDTIPPLRILMVEDHQPTQVAMKRLLEARGHHVEACASAEAALGFPLHAVDVVFCDIGLPDATGHDLFADLRNKRADLVGFALSGYGSSEDISLSRAAGFCEHLVKPLSSHFLDEALKRQFAREKKVGD